MMNTKLPAIALGGLTTLVGLYLALDRSGVLPWLIVLLGAAATMFVLFGQPKRPLALTLGAALIPALMWVGVFYYVISTWESGEVVELTLDTSAGSKTARVWVMDINSSQYIYYDAGPAAAHAILSGKPLQMKRGESTNTYTPQAVSETDISAEQTEQIYAAMADKYGDKVKAADLFYVMLGRSADRIGVVAKLIP